MSKAVEELTLELVKHLRNSIPELAEVHTEWPEANQELQYPSLTIFSNAPKFTNLDPYKYRQSEVNSSNQVTTDWIVGMYDLTMQIDLWCRNKKERDTLWEKVFQALNPKVIPMGLSLQLPGYFDTWARCDLDGFRFDDSEAVAQRREWRVKADLLAHCKSVLSTTDYAIVSVEKQIETPDNIPNP
jgi:hypothetical protein